MLLQALLGVQTDGINAEVHIRRPALPIGIESIEIAGLEVGGSGIDLNFQRIGTGVVAVPIKQHDTNVRVLAHL
jgi:hypothetical protein